MWPGMPWRFRRVTACDISLGQTWKRSAEILLEPDCDLSVALGEDPGYGLGVRLDAEVFERRVPVLF